MQIEINDEFKQALNILSKTNDNVFITGKAGTGKTTFLKYYTSKCNKKFVILAPTGVAALNAGGETIHSFFRFKTDITLEKIKKRKFNNSIYKNLDIIIIDEASMLRADLLDCVEKFLRLNGKVPNLPFGGTQIVFIGDLLQLPPVVTNDEQYIFESYYDSPYFFSAKCMKENCCHIVEFTKIYRQVDSKFINILNLIRNNRATQNSIDTLNEQVNKKFPKAKLSVLLTTTNKKAQKYNEHFLSQIDSEEKIFTAEVEDMENANNFPADYELKIKVGAQVMMLNNDPSDRWVNGTIGTVQSIEKSLELDEYIIYVKFQDATVEPVEQYTWELFKYTWNDELKKIETQKAGSFSQYPLKLAWAVTIHKSQGKTFDNVLIDLGYGTFAPGQLYVALSRCKSIEGISLVRPIKPKDIITDNRIEQFLNERIKTNYLIEPKYKLI